MSGMFNPIVFYPVAITMLLFAVLTINFKNIFYSLLSAISLFILVGIIYYILGSEYNAIIQIAIYGVAIPVILGLAIMFTNLKKDNKKENGDFVFKSFVLLVALLFISVFIFIVKTSLLVNSYTFSINEDIGSTFSQVINAFGHGIFINYVWAFELISVILTIIVVGLTLFCKKEKK